MATTTTNTQSEWKRKATARKGQATRLRNEAKRKRSLAQTARTRSRAEANALVAASYQAGRAVDASVGAVSTARDVVTGAVRPLGEPRRSIGRLRQGTTRAFQDLERKGQTARRRAQRDIGRVGKRAQHETQARTPA